MDWQSFLNELDAKVARFKVWYNTEHSKDPVNFPKTYESSADWWEQFNAWSDSDDASQAEGE